MVLKKVLKKTKQTIYSYALTSKLCDFYLFSTRYRKELDFLLANEIRLFIKQTKKGAQNPSSAAENWRILKCF